MLRAGQPGAAIGALRQVEDRRRNPVPGESRVTVLASELLCEFCPASSFEWQAGMRYKVSLLTDAVRIEGHAGQLLSEWWHFSIAS
jgi:hypothetical protein